MIIIITVQHVKVDKCYNGLKMNKLDNNIQYLNVKIRQSVIQQQHIQDNIQYLEMD